MTFDHLALHNAPDRVRVEWEDVREDDLVTSVREDGGFNTFDFGPSSYVGRNEFLAASRPRPTLPEPGTVVEVRYGDGWQRAWAHQHGGEVWATADDGRMHRVETLYDWRPIPEPEQADTGQDRAGGGQAMGDLTTTAAIAAIAYERAPRPRGGSVNFRVVCADGFKVSIQASQMHYAHDSSDKAPYWKGLDPEIAYPFTTCEIGNPSGPLPDEWDEWESGGVWAWVPVDAVARLLDLHGLSLIHI